MAASGDDISMAVMCGWVVCGAVCVLQRAWALAEMLRAVSLLTGGEGRW
jgi:hypothetical protein